MTFACGCVSASFLLWPGLPDNLVARSTFTLFALCLGACVGRQIDCRVR
jgi:hypothetical protein